MNQPTRAKSWALPVLGGYFLLVVVMALLLHQTDLKSDAVVGMILPGLRKWHVLEDVRFGHIEAAANVLLFIPIGFLTTFALKYTYWLRGLIAIIAFSVFIETVQMLFLSGRVGSVRDVICNALGAILGTVLTLLLRRGRV